MKFTWHIATGIPFLLLGAPWAVLGCVLPDLAWVPNELRFRLSPIQGWGQWSKVALPSRWTLGYWVLHSMLLLTLLLIALWHYPIARQILAGCLLHQLLDLPTHRGVMAQQPLFPFSWRWKWK